LEFDITGIADHHFYGLDYTTARKPTIPLAVPHGACCDDNLSALLTNIRRDVYLKGMSGVFISPYKLAVFLDVQKRPL
jgi:hypothetical protein